MLDTIVQVLTQCVLHKLNINVIKSTNKTKQVNKRCVDITSLVSGHNNNANLGNHWPLSLTMSKVPAFPAQITFPRLLTPVLKKLYKACCD